LLHKDLQANIASHNSLQDNCTVVCILCITQCSWMAACFKEQDRKRLR